MLYVQWQAFWLLHPGAGEAREKAFLVMYGLEIATIVVDDVEIVVVRPRSGFYAYWVLWFAYVVSDAADCVDGCQQSRLPWQD